jgi:hypothetical protein
MSNRDLLVERLAALPYVKAVWLGPAPSDKAALHTEPAFMLRCNFTNLDDGARAEMYLLESLLDSLEAHDSIVENVASLFSRFPPLPAEGFDPSNP